MKLILPSLCLSGIFAAAALEAAPQRLETYLPAETSVVISVNSVSEARGKVKESALKSLSENEKLNEFFKPLEKELTGKEDDEDDLITNEEFDKFVTGQVVFGLDMSPNLKAIKNGADIMSEDPLIILLANMSDAEGFDELIMKRADEQLEDDESSKIFDDEDFMGISIHHISTTEKTASEGTESSTLHTAPVSTKGSEIAQVQYDDEDAGDYEEYDEGYDDNSSDEEKAEPKVHNFYFGAVKDTYFATCSLEGAHALVEAIKEDSQSTFGKTDEWADLRASTEDMDAYMFISATKLAILCNELIRQSVPPQDLSQPMSPSAEAIIKAIGLDSLHSIQIGLKFRPENVLIKSITKLDTNYGIGRIFTAIGNSYPKPDFVPQAPASINATGINVGVYISELRQMIFNAYPQASMFYQMYTGQIQQQGVNLDTDLINNFDEGLVVFNMDKEFPPKGQPQNLLAFKIKDADSFKRAVDSIIVATGSSEKVERRNYMGTELILLPGPTVGTPSAVLAIKDGWLMFSPNLSCLQNALSTNDGGKSFWNSNTFKSVDKALDSSDGYQVSYYDTTMLVRTLLTAFAMGYNTQIMQGGDNEDKLLDPDIISDIEDLKVMLIAKGYKTPDALVQETYLISTEE